MEIVLFLLGLIAGCLTAHFYYRKSTRDLKTELSNLKDALQDALRPRTSLADFEAIRIKCVAAARIDRGRECLGLRTRQFIPNCAG
jgi:hypothetical protein